MTGAAPTGGRKHSAQRLLPFSVPLRSWIFSVAAPGECTGTGIVAVTQNSPAGPLTCWLYFSLSPHSFFYVFATFRVPDRREFLSQPLSQAPAY